MDYSFISTQRPQDTIFLLYEQNNAQFTPGLIHFRITHTNAHWRKRAARIRFCVRFIDEASCNKIFVTLVIFSFKHSGQFFFTHASHHMASHLCRRRETLVHFKDKRKNKKINSEREKRTEASFPTHIFRLKIRYMNLIVGSHTINKSVLNTLPVSANNSDHEPFFSS